MTSGSAKDRNGGVVMKRRDVLAVVALGCLAMGALPSRRGGVPTSQKPSRRAFFAAIRPVHLANCTLRRFGAAHDGGYLMCGNLMAQVQSAYSYGIGRKDDWGCDVSRASHVTVHEYDCFDPTRPACPGGTFQFHDECVGATRAVENGRLFRSMAKQIARNGDRGKHLVIKMDVEGAEWESLEATPDDVLMTIDQLVMELHDPVRRQHTELIERLKKTFYIANVHFNNASCLETPPLPSSLVEILFVNKRLAVVDGAAFVASPLDAPNVTKQPDCQAHWQLAAPPGAVGGRLK